MNEEKKGAAPVNSTIQNVVHDVLPDDLKTKFAFQKNGVPIPQFDANGNVTSPLNKSAVEKLDPNLVQKPIRTFESDLAEALAKKQGSVASISIAESKKKIGESRQMEAAQAPQQPAPQAPVRPMVRPISPTSSTAIPGAVIPIPGTIPHDATTEIQDGLKAAQPAQPVRPQPQFQTQVSATPPPVPKPSVSPIKVPPPPPKQVPVAVSGSGRSIARPIILTLLSFVFIGGGLFAGYAFYEQNKTAVEPLPTVAPIIVPSLIPNDANVQVTVQSEMGDNLITKIYSEVNKITAAPGKTTDVQLFENLNGKTGRITASTFLSKLNTRIPDIIVRSLTDRWMLGVYGEETGQKTTFMALTTDFFQNTFAGMLSWEERGMADDLALLLNFKDRARRQDLQASSTSAYFGIKGTFSDKVIRNRDVRQFKNSNGELLFLYSFINKETLILTTTESSFMALIDRIEKDAYVR